MMSQTLRPGFPLLAAGQAQKEVTHNEAVLAIDRLLQLTVVTRSLVAPPPMPEVGSSYIVGPTATGAWAGNSDAIAFFDGFGWTHTVPMQGWLAWIADESGFAVFDGAWSTGGWPASGLKIGNREVMGEIPQEIIAPVGGTTIDTEGRAALVQLIQALREQGIIA